MKRYLILGVACCCLGASVRAEVVGVASVLQAALEHSYARRSSQQEVEAAAAREAQAAARGRPSLDVGARATQYSGLEEALLGSFLVPEIDQRYGAFAVVTQPLYTGGRISGQREAESFSRQAAVAGQEAVTAGVALETLATYWAWSRAGQSVEAARAAVDRMQALYDDVRHQHEAGLVTDNDLLSTEVELERARLRQDTAGQQLQLARAQVVFLTGQPLDVEATPEIAPAPAGPDLPGEAEQLAAAFSNRPERAARAAEVAAAAAHVKVRKADRGPTVNARAGYEYANPNQLFFPPDDEWNDDAYVGVEVSWNVWDPGLTRGALAEAAARQMQVELRRDQADADITLNVRSARIRLQESLNRYQVSTRARESARGNVESATALWKNGLARQSEVLDAQARLADAEAAVVDAVADVAVGRAALDFACGALGTTNLSFVMPGAVEASQ